MRPSLTPVRGGPIAAGPVPSFSVVVAAYQAAGTIGEALASVFEQTLTPIDVVVCDDGSTDDLDTALAPYLYGITLVRQPNQGEGAAKNAAVRAAEGDFAAILDADDVFLPERLEALGELAASRPDLDVITTDAFLEVDGSTVRRCYDASWTFETHDQRGVILERNFVFGLAAVRRSRFLEIGGFDESLRYAADWDLWCRMILDGARVGLVAEPLARYRLQRTSLSAQRARLLRGKCVVLEKVISRSDLSVAERERAGAALTRERRSALLAEAHAALIELSPHARRLALRVATARAIPPPTRIRALAALVAPRFASSRLARAEKATGVSGPAGVQFPV